MNGKTIVFIILPFPPLPLQIINIDRRNITIRHVKFVKAFVTP